MLFILCIASWLLAVEFLFIYLFIYLSILFYLFIYFFFFMFCPFHCLIIVLSVSVLAF